MDFDGYNENIGGFFGVKVLLSTTGGMALTLGVYNPLRYRGVGAVTIFDPKEKEADILKIKRCAIWIVGIVLFLLVFPYIKVEILTINAREKLESFNISYFDNVYCEGTPEIYDCKIYAYKKDQYAKVLYILGDCEFGVMVELKWNNQDECWEFSNGQNLWSIYGGSAQEFYWPLYYGDKLYPSLKG